MGVLYELAVKYKANKTEPETRHYCDLYERYFSSMRDRDIKLLEIGVQKGGSLRILRWSDGI